MNQTVGSCQEGRRLQTAHDSLFPFQGLWGGGTCTWPFTSAHMRVHGHEFVLLV
ncbi:unnamed protein product, partial [Marmota monax]